MIMFYFSGTGNSKYIAELFCTEMDAACHSIEENVDFGELIDANEVIGFCYPIYASRVPRIMREFVYRHMQSFKGKKLIIFCTQLLFSGDGARAFAAMFPRDYIEVIYAEHFLMPNNVSNLFICPVTNDTGIEKCITRAQNKMKSVCNDIKNDKVKKRGFNVISQILGLIQGVWISALEKKANNSISISNNCTNCHICVSVCPMQNLVYENERITHKHNCTICYRCINKCPKKAINVFLRGKVRKQYKGI